MVVRPSWIGVGCTVVRESRLDESWRTPMTVGKDPSRRAGTQRDNFGAVSDLIGRLGRVHLDDEDSETANGPWMASLMQARETEASGVTDCRVGTAALTRCASVA